MATTQTFKIVCAQPSKGIERSLPYVLDDVDAINLCTMLNNYFEQENPALYIHRVEAITPTPEKIQHKNGRKGKR